MAGLSPQQLSAIYAAGQAGDTAAYGHATGTGIGGAIEGSLQGSGDFSQGQLDAFNTDWNSGTGSNGAWGNGAPPGDSWSGQIQQYLGSVPNAPNTSGLSQTQQDQSSFAPTVQQLQSAAPLSYSNFGTTPVLGTSTYNASTPQAAGMVTGASIDPAQSNDYLNQNMNLLQSELAPQFAQQNEGLNEQLASRGIFNSGASQQAATDLGQKQTATLAGAQQPLISQGYGYQQSDLQQNAANAQAASLANQGTQTTQNDYAAQLQQEANAGNTASTNATNQYNANAYTQQTTNDQNAYNQYQAYLVQQGLGSYNSLQGAYLNTYAPANSTALSGLNQGASNAGSAYSNAYNNSNSGSAGLGGLFSGVGKQAVSGPANTTPTGAPSGGYQAETGASNGGTDQAGIDNSIAWGQ